ncbi:hypothetical protein JCM10207_004786 [Rhodosporidiobolus poonsookiae]
MSHNLSETSATRRLLQIPYLGLFQNDVRPKFAKSDQLTTDIDPEWKRIMGQTVKAMDKVFAADPELKKMNWTPVLYAYELYKGHAKRSTDYGQLCFVDNTCTRFLLVRAEGSVKCASGNCPLDHDYREILDVQAHQFFNLAKYLQGAIPEVKWVRGTFTTAEYRSVPEDLFHFKGDKKLSSRPTTGRKPGIVHVDGSNFKPCLSKDDVETIDAFLGTCKKPIPTDAQKKLVVVAGGRGAREYDPVYLPPEMVQEPKRNSGGCKEMKDSSELKRCSGCRATFYCSRACQVGHWPVHKAMCRPAKPKGSKH